jgi:hypothetical protein
MQIVAKSFEMWRFEEANPVAHIKRKNIPEVRYIKFYNVEICIGDAIANVPLRWHLQYTILTF